MRTKKNLIRLAILMGLLSFSPKTQAQKLVSEGVWRGVFHYPNQTDIPFNFEIKGKNISTAKVYLINGEEHFPASQIFQKGDSLIIPFDQFDNELVLNIHQTRLEGILRRKDRTGKVIKVDAVWGQNFRFLDNGENPLFDISGKYDVIFKTQNGGEEKRVGLFHQKGNKLYASFLSITGDSRYLEGIVQGNKFYLSSFIGGGVGYYSGTVDSVGHLSGTAYGNSFIAIKNEKAALPDPYKLTYLKEGYTRFDFSLPDIDGRKVSLRDEKYKNKVVIVTITGTWCPNCMDEAGFLSPWFDKNQNRGVEALAIHFERKLDSTYLRNAIGNFKRRFGIHYDEVIGGLVNKQAVAETFSALNTFLSFPTILFIDKQGNVDKIYTGFTGPATGEYYKQFIKEFNEEVDKLLNGKNS